MYSTVVFFGCTDNMVADNNPDRVVGSGIVSVGNSAANSVNFAVAVDSHDSATQLLFLDRNFGSVGNCHQFCCMFFLPHRMHVDVAKRHACHRK